MEIHVYIGLEIPPLPGWTGHSEREAEIPRLAGCFSLYPTSLLGGLGGLSTMASLLFSPEGKRGSCRQGTIGFPLLGFSVSGAQGTCPPEDQKGHSLFVGETSREVLGKVRHSPNLGETCCNSASFLDNSVVFASVWQKLPLPTLTCLCKGTE